MFSLIQSSAHIGIFTHINPDGDALGSSFGLAGFISDRGKDVTVFLPGPVSDSLQFMVCDDRRFGVLSLNGENADSIRDAVCGCDLIIGVDFNVLDRIGGLAPFVEESGAKKILIDHHVAPQEDAFDLVYSRTDVSSASELVYSLLMRPEAAGGDVSGLSVRTREALLTGMTTDTNNFANSVFPSTLRMASDLLEAGTDRDRIIDNLYFKYPERCIRLRGYALDKLMKINDKGVGYIIIDADTMRRFDVHEGDTEGLVNIPLSVDRVRMSILAKEEPDSERIRISIRSKKGTSARKCSMGYFHGGGHTLASGGRLTKGEDVRDITEVEAYIEKMSELFFVE